jgi:putative DNA primase/helicase
LQRCRTEMLSSTAKAKDDAYAEYAHVCPPAWAVGDTGELSKFPVLSGIESLTILVDHDKSGAGQRAALECSSRWTGAGREVFRIIPDHCGDDVNDIVQRARR